MRSLTFLPLSLAALAVTPAAAEDPSCSVATAKPTSVAAIIADEGGSGDCVTVNAIAWKGALYDDVAQIYAEPRRARDPRRLGNRIAFYPPYRVDEDEVVLLGGPEFPAEAATGFADRARFVSATGTLSLCRYGAVKGPQLILPFTVDEEACKGRGGVRLNAEAVTVDAARAVERQRPGQGVPARLVPLAPDSPWAPRFEAAADAVLAALRSRDAGAWVPLFGGQWLAGADRAQIEHLLDDRDSPLRRVLAAKGSPHRRIFGWRLPATLSAADRESIVAAPEAEALVCWSSQGDADRLWPLAAFDADNRPGRPYACVRIAYSIRDETSRWRAFVEEGRGGLAEPES